MARWRNIHSGNTYHVIPALDELFSRDASFRFEDNEPQPGDISIQDVAQLVGPSGGGDLTAELDAFNTELEI